MFMDYNFDFIVTKAYFDKLEITNIINRYNQKKHDITGKNSTVGSLCNNMGIPALQVHYVLCGRHIIQIFHPTGMSYLLYHTNKQWMPDIGDPISSSIPWGVQSQS